MPNRSRKSAPMAAPFGGSYHDYFEHGYTGRKVVAPRTRKRGGLKALTVLQPFHEYHYHEWGGVQGERYQTTNSVPSGHLRGPVNVHHDVRGSLDSGMLSLMHPDTVSSANLLVSKVQGTPLAEREQMLINKLRLKMSKPEANLGIMLGERRETAQLFCSVASNLFAAVQFARRGDFVSGTKRLLALGSAPKLHHSNRSIAAKRKIQDWRDLANESAGTWLGLQYGVLPLISDVHDTVMAFSKRHEDRQPILRFATKGGTELKGESTMRQRTAEASSFSGQPGWSYVNEVIYAEQTVHMVIEMVESNPFTRRLAEFGVANPLSIVWELVPFSFVVDWFIPVGNYIQGVVPPAGIEFRKGYMTVKGSGRIDHYEGRDGWLEASPDGRNTNIVGAYGAYASREETWKWRKSIPSLPAYEYVQPDISLTNSQLTSGIALLWQLRNLLK